MKKGKVWFVVELKSFEISVGAVKGKLGCTVLERSQGFSSWIRFDGHAWRGGGFYRNVLGKSFKKDWMKRGKSYRLELQSNLHGHDEYIREQNITLFQAFRSLEKTSGDLIELDRETHYRDA